MNQRSDWIPGRREDVLNLGKVWMTVLAQKYTAWNIPQGEVTELVTLTGTADAALATAKGSDRNQKTTAACRAAFEALVQKLRFIKERYVHAPPLLEADYPALLLKPRDSIPTPAPPPAEFAEADVSFPGPGVLELRCRPVAGQDPADVRGDYGYRIYWGIYPPGGAGVELATGKRRLLMNPPATGDDLPHSQWTRRRKERLDFHEDRGSTVYFCIRCENSKGQAGPWGPLFPAIVP
ncbi:MAG: hypothetical protein LBD31_07085 [Treponema sp.]|jgi:hypothetical protein|nr:hypothetical protein [Treponema sp.]